MVAIILIGLPLFAWYYLSKGTQMRKDAMVDLAVKSEVGNFQSVTDSDSIFYSESFQGKRWIVGIIGADSSRTHGIELLKNIYKQSKEEFTIHLFTIVGLFSGEMISDMSRQFELTQDRNWIKTYMAAKHIYLFSEDAFAIPEKYKNKNIVVLVDEFGKIRQYYDLSDDAEVKKMVRQIPVFLSLKL